jgi:hypothetical protein
VVHTPDNNNNNLGNTLSRYLIKSHSTLVNIKLMNGINNKTIKKGDTVFIASDSPRHKGEEYEATVTAVGRKYITVDNGYQEKFDICTGCMVGWNDWQIYPSREAYNLAKENNEKIDYINWHLSTIMHWEMTTEEIDTIYQIIKKYRH